MSGLTEAEQNRLIVEHKYMVGPIASQYRNRKGIPFDEIEAEGMVGLVKAARKWKPSAKFSTYAWYRIHGEIKDFIRRWKDNLSELKDEFELTWDHELFEWKVFPRAAHYETWRVLPATAEALAEAYREIAGNKSALSSALLSFNKFDRQIFEARFLRNPNKLLASIAREQKISYCRVVFLLNRSLKNLRKTVRKIEARADTIEINVPSAQVPIEAGLVPEQTLNFCNVAENG